jgi:hypothetical protein
MKKLLGLFIVLALGCAGLHAQTTNMISLPTPAALPRPVYNVSKQLTAAQTTVLFTALTAKLGLPAGTTLVGVRLYLVPGQTQATLGVQVKASAPVTTQ